MKEELLFAVKISLYFTLKNIENYKTIDEKKQVTFSRDSQTG